MVTEERQFMLLIVFETTYFVSTLKRKDLKQ